MQPNIQANACLYHLHVMYPPNTCLLAWYLEAIVMKMMSVQVGSAGHADALQNHMTLSRLSMVSWSCCLP